MDDHVATIVGNGGSLQRVLPRQNHLPLRPRLARQCLGGPLYFLYVRPLSVEDSNAAVQLEITYKADRFVQRLGELKQIELSGDILADRRFSSLTTYTKPVQVEPIGKENPFEVTE